MEKIIATYHKDCIDGTAAAAVVLRRFPDAQLFPLAHSYTAEDLSVVLEAAKGATHAYTVDCGLGAKELLAHGLAVTTIDHHVSAKEEFEALAKEHAQYTFVFDVEKSGASLAWSYFFPDEPQPDLIKYVEDADLWKWQYGDATKYVNNYLSMFRNDPAYTLGLLKGDLDEVMKKGEVIAMYADQEIEKQVSIPSINLRIGEYIVPAFNITVYESASGNILSEKLDQAVAMFTVKGDMVTLSFRSKDHQTPTSVELAQTLGGGGHKNAAGAAVPLSTFIEMLSS